MKFITPYTVNLSVNLEPIYAIIFALLIFKNSELMNINFYIGSLIVVGSILINALFKKQRKFGLKYLRKKLKKLEYSIEKIGGLFIKYFTVKSLFKDHKTITKD